MIPYFLFAGLPPANALATAKLGGIGTAIGSLTAFKGKGLVHKKLVVPFMIITFICSLISAWLIPRIDPSAFENLIGAAYWCLSRHYLSRKHLSSLVIGPSHGL